ncbi:hypothetical protein HaLaN_19982, partial [Haematococcus lacustris]
MSGSKGGGGAGQDLTLGAAVCELPLKTITFDLPTLTLADQPLQPVGRGAHQGQVISIHEVGDRCALHPHAVSHSIIRTQELLTNAVNIESKNEWADVAALLDTLVRITGR